MHIRRITGADAFIGAVLLLNLLFIVTCYSRMEAYGADSSSYIGIAQSLSETGRYAFNSSIHTKYPPGLPIILYLSSEIFGLEGFTDYVRLIGFFAILAAAASYWYLRLHNSRYALVITLLLLSSPWFFQLSTMVVYSEMPYFFTSMAALICACLLDKASRGKRWPLSILLCVAVAASILLRSAAVALPAGMILFVVFSYLFAKEQAIRRLQLFLPAIAVGVLVFVLWNIWSASYRTPFYQGQYMDSYLAQMFMKNPHIPDLGQASFMDFFLRVGDNTGRIFADLSQLGLNYPYISSIFYSPAVILPLICLGIGLSAALAHLGGSVAAWYLLCYIALFAAWPFQEGPRFILPIFPLAAYFFFIGAETFWKQVQASPKRYAPYGLLFAVSLLAAAFVDLAVNTANLGRQSLLSVAFWAAVALFSLAVWKNYRGFARVFNTPPPRMAAAGHTMLWAFFMIIVLAGYFQQTVFAAFNFNPDPQRYPNHRSVAAAFWIDENMTDEGILMAEQHALIHRLTGNRVTPFPVTEDAQTIRGVIEGQAVDYLIVIDTREYTYFRPTQERRLKIFKEQYPGFLGHVHQGEGFQVFMVMDHTGAAMDHMPKAEAKPFWTYITETDPYTSWPTWPSKDGIDPGKSPHGAYLKLFVNQPALEAIKNDEPMPAGAIIVKENYGKDKKSLKAITPMYLKKDYNPEGGDWFWAKYANDGQVMAAGKVDSCIKCHQTQMNWLFTGK